MSRHSAKIITGCGFFWFLIFIIIFIPLYIRGNINELETKCEVIDREGKSCTYQRCTGSGNSRRCYTVSSRQYKHKYMIKEDKCNDKTFSAWGSCQGSEKYSIGKKRKCYLKHEKCNDVSFDSSDSYLIGAWVMLSFACLSFLIYIFGLYQYHSY